MATSKAAARTAINGHLGTKKSCDLCVSRKRKCDGAIPCSFCVSRGRECHYSLRRPNRPRGYAKLLAKGGGGAAGHGHGHGHANGSSWSGSGGGEEKGSSPTQMQHGHPEAPIIGWKRVRLSASPATGLVGMKENSFLGWFFDCLGFLPLSSESLVRQAIMEVFLRFSPETEGVTKAGRTERPPPPSNAAKEEPGMGMGMETGTGGDSGGKQEQQRGSEAASTCTLWCTVAMGALVQGQPPERVAPYMRLAWISLSQCFDTASAETARAFVMMAYLHNFLRNDHMFHRYLLFAEGIVNRLPDSTPQKQEIVGLLARANDTRIYHTEAYEAWELDAYCEDDNRGRDLQVPNVVSKSSLCRLLLEADRRLIKAFLRDHKAQVVAPSGEHVPEERQAHSSTCGGRVNPTADRFGESGKGQGHRSAKAEGRAPPGEGAGGEGLKGGSRDSNRDGVAEISATVGKLSLKWNTMEDGADPSSPGGETSACTARARETFGRLQATAKMPEIGAGVGGVIYNAIFGYLDIVTTDGSQRKLGFAKIKECSKVFVRLHLSHCLLSILAGLEDAAVFEELRQAYNSVRRKNDVEAPAYEEWTMVGFCNHIFCRSFDHLRGSDAGTTSDTSDAGDADRQDRQSPQKDQKRAGAPMEGIHSIHLPHCHPGQTWAGDPGQTWMLPKTELSDQVPETSGMATLQNPEWSDEALETNGIPTLQPLDLTSVAGLSGVGPIEPCQSVLSIAGLLGVTARPGSLDGSRPTSPATFSNGQATCGQSPSAVPVQANALGLGCYSTGAPISSDSGTPSQQRLRATDISAQVSDATTRQTCGEKVAFWGDRTDSAVIGGGGDAGGTGKASEEQNAFGSGVFWPHGH